MKEILRNKKVIIVSLASLIVVFILLITLKDSYAYYGGSNELEIMKATIGKLKPTIEKVFIEEENKQYTNNPNPSVTIEWTDDNITEYCVTTEDTCSAFTTIQEPNTNSKSVTATNQITLNGETKHTVNAYIKNKYGYISEVKSSSIILDTTAPTISSLSTTEINETSVTISFEGNDAISGVSQYCYSTTGGNYTCDRMSDGRKTFTINGLESGTNYTVYVYLIDNAGNEGKSSPKPHTFKTTSKTAGDVIIATSKSLESEEAMRERNDAIKAAGGNVPDDLRRFVGDKTKVTDNFICFGTDDQDDCKNDMDTYMYRIIGIDTSDRLKLIKATEVRDGYMEFFRWNMSETSDARWDVSDLYKGLNGQSSSYSEDSYTCYQCFVGNDRYNYMQQVQWTNLISPITYYIGASTASTDPELFINERKENFNSDNNIGLMYLSDYLYANNGTASKNNWLFIQNGLNGASSTGGSEWTMTKYGQGKYGTYNAWLIGNAAGTVVDMYLGSSDAVRPVFYLIPTTQISNGNGTIENPYMIAP